MPFVLSEFTEDKVRYLVITTPDGVNYRMKRDEVFSYTWEGIVDQYDGRKVIVQPPPGQSIALGVGTAFSWDAEAVGVEWFIRGPNGSDRSLGTTNIAAGQTAAGIYLLTPAINPAGYATYTAEMIQPGGALCVEASEDCGIYVTGWML